MNEKKSRIKIETHSYTVLNMKVIVPLTFSMFCAISGSLLYYFSVPPTAPSGISNADVILISTSTLSIFLFLTSLVELLKTRWLFKSRTEILNHKDLGDGTKLVELATDDDSPAVKYIVKPSNKLNPDG